jgi:3-hydroxyisobutyrate dehydrogenase
LKIGIAGTGRMGSAIATRLLGLGRSVLVWNRSPDKLGPLMAAGATAMDSPKDLARDADIVITILTDAAAIDALYEGPAGLLAPDIGGKLFIEMSTVRPDTEVALAAKIRAKGAALVDCPVGGSVGPAKEGKLFGFVGGEAGDVAHARAVLEQLCRRVEHVGPVGAGARLKLAINLPLLVYWEAFAEALALIAPLGLDPARVVDILADTSGGPNVLKTRGAALAAAMSGKPPANVTVDIETMRKDLRTMVEEAAAAGIALPVTARTLECFDQTVAAGEGARDITAFATRALSRSGYSRP